MTVRHDAITALIAVLNPAYPWVSPVSNRLQLIYNVQKTDRPVCFVFQGGIEKYEWTNNTLPRRIMPVRLYIYTAAQDQINSDADVQDAILDAIDSALAPKGADMVLGRNTLGGAVYNCRIKGGVLRVPGDLDGDGMLVLPIDLTLP